jgi:anti-sigma factor RsiW
MSAMAPVDCRELIMFLGEYLANELPADRRAAFEKHLAICNSCVDYLATYEETIRMARAAATAPEPNVEEMPEELVKAILDATTRK